MEPEDIEIPPEQVERAVAFMLMLMLFTFAVVFGSTWGVPAGLTLLSLGFVVVAGILIRKLVKTRRMDSRSKEAVIRARVAVIDEEIEPRKQERLKLQEELETIQQKKGYRGSH